VVDDIGVENCPAACGEDLHSAAGAMRAKWARRKVGLAAGTTPLQPQFTSVAAVPKMPGLGRWLRERSSYHFILQLG
jgi:hypothetical protein